MRDVQAGQIAVDRLIQVVHIVLQTVRPDRHPAHGGSGRQRDVGTVVVNVLLDLDFHIIRQLVAGAGKILMPLNSIGLWEAEMTTPASALYFLTR